MEMRINNVHIFLRANEEKVVYFLLLYRKEKAPEMGEDDMEATMVTGHVQTGQLT